MMKLILFSFKLSFTYRLCCWEDGLTVACVSAVLLCPVDEWRLGLLWGPHAARGPSYTRTKITIFTSPHPPILTPTLSGEHLTCAT